jgi:hypothetical protein
MVSTHAREKGARLDESAALPLRGKLCRVNPVSARGMKQSLRAV